MATNSKGKMRVIPLRGPELIRKFILAKGSTENPKVEPYKPGELVYVEDQKRLHIDGDFSCGFNYHGEFPTEADLLVFASSGNVSKVWPGDLARVGTGEGAKIYFCTENNGTLAAEWSIYAANDIYTGTNEYFAGLTFSACLDKLRGWNQALDSDKWTTPPNAGSLGWISTAEDGSPLWKGEAWPGGGTGGGGVKDRGLWSEMMSLKTPKVADWPNTDYWYESTGANAPTFVNNPVGVVMASSYLNSQEGDGIWPDDTPLFGFHMKRRPSLEGSFTTTVLVDVRGDSTVKSGLFFGMTAGLKITGLVVRTDGTVVHTTSASSSSPLLEPSITGTLTVPEKRMWLRVSGHTSIGFDFYVSVDGATWTKVGNTYAVIAEDAAWNHTGIGVVAGWGSNANQREWYVRGTVYSYHSNAGTTPTAPEKGEGSSAWVPTLTVTSDGERRVLQITGWTSGTGEPPATTGYIGSAGIVATAAEAVDIRGPAGSGGGGGGLWAGIMSAAPTISGIGSVLHQSAPLAVSDSPNGVCISGSSGGFTRASVGMAAPASPYTLTALVSTASVVGGYAMTGIGWRRADGAAINFCHQCGGGLMVECGRWNGDTAWGATIATAAILPSSMLWIRLRHDGANITAEISPNGELWRQVYASTVAANPLGPTGLNQLAFSASANSGLVAAVLHSWALTTP